MLDTITSLVASTYIFANSLLPVQSPAPATSFTHVLPEKQYVSYKTQEHDSFKAVSRLYYGTDSYWKNIWNDNPGIENPDDITHDLLLTVRSEKPVTESTLRPELQILSDNQDKMKYMQQQEEAQKQYETKLAQVALLKPTETLIPTQAPVAQASRHVAGGISEEAINYLGSCEAGLDPAKNTGNGYYGAFQFSYGTWKSMNTGYERADLAPLEVQKAAVQQLLQRSSIYTQFPGCAAKMSAAGII